MFESQNPEKINIKDLSLDVPEKEGKTPEELREEFRNFLIETFSKWYSYNAALKARIPEATDHLPELITPHDQDWRAKKADKNPSKFGEYTINPETIDIDWEAIPPEKITTKELANDWNGKPLADVAEYIIKTYGADYYIPGLEYWKYILEHPSEVPDKLKDGNSHFFFGSILRGAFGSCVPLVRWSDSDVPWLRQAIWLANVWRSHHRVVLLEKSAVVRKSKSFDKPTPPMPEVRKF